MFVSISMAMRTGECAEMNAHIRRIIDEIGGTDREQKYAFFISHYHANAGDIARILNTKLER